MKPSTFVPYDLMQENYTRQLWIFEGITSYYDDQVLLRTGLMSEAVYLEMMGKTLSGLLRNPGTQVQHLEDASFDAWIKYYRQDENSPNSIVSYYTKGAIVAWLLDVLIQHGTKGKQSLDDVMLAMWQQYRGVDEGAFEKLVQTVTGVDLTKFFEDALRSTKPLPVQKILRYAGIEYQERAAKDSQDMGGLWLDHVVKAHGIGVRCRQEAAGVRLTYVLSGSPAEAAGLAANDLVLAVNSLKANVEMVESAQGEKLYFFRRDELKQCRISQQVYEVRVCALRKRNV
jgi:predicted metalloprotease with PDZ domain